MLRNIGAFVCWTLLSACASFSQVNPPRFPLGVYAHVDVEAATQRKPCSEATTVAALHMCLQQLYSGLLETPAISGIAAGVHWDHIQLSDPLCAFQNNCASGTVDGYDWSYVDDVFTEANAAGKSVLLMITPGVDAPPWLLAKLPTCDGLFNGAGGAPADCGQVTFDNFPEEQHADGDPPVLPLPWNPLYIAAWDNLLAHLNLRYRSNTAFVAIGVAGPVCASTEMILPTTANNSTTPPPSNLGADQAWMALIAHSFPDVRSYQNSDQVFIDAWKQTIDAYERIFSGVTLFLSPDSGSDLPELPSSFRDNTLLGVDCSTAKQPLSCQAKTEVLSYFVTAAGPNQKATQVGGMTASSQPTTGDIGVPGVKVLTSIETPPFFGGAEFDFAVSDSTTVEQEGCPTWPNTPCMPFGLTLTPEEAAYNVLTVFFDGTSAYADFGGTSGTEPIQYVELDYTDIQYAQKNPCATLPSTLPGAPSLQDLINLASYDLFGMAGQQTTLPPHTCPTSDTTPGR
jgi:hypothetical protein